MNMRLIVPAVVVVLAGLSILGYGIIAESRSSDADEPLALASSARAAGSDKAGDGSGGLIPSEEGFSEIQEATAAGKYAFLFFYRREDAQTKKMRGVFDAAMDRMRDRAEPLFIDVDDPQALPLVDRYGAGRATP